MQEKHFAVFTARVRLTIAWTCAIAALGTFAPACGPATTTAGGPPGPANAAPSGSDQMVFKNANGRDVVPMSEVTVVDVSISTAMDSTGSPIPALSATFWGPDAGQLVRQFKLNNLAEDQFVSGFQTGTITLHYVTVGSPEAKVRRLSIEDDTLLEDAANPGVTYQQGQKLDAAWLLSQVRRN